MLDASLISFAEAAKYLPAGRRPSYSTWWRWFRKGVRGIRLKTYLVGGRRYTTVDDIRTFVNQLSSSNEPSPPLQAPLISSQIDSAETSLRMAGILRK